jgi:hypothetical protein
MGAAGRALAEERFDVHAVNRAVLEAMDLMSPRASRLDSMAPFQNGAKTPEG